MKKIGIINYGLGNIGSVLRMIEKVGGTAIKISLPDEIYQAEKIILPGVGHFDHGVRLLQEKGLVTEIQTVAKQGTPILGICLGMQLLFDNSQEGTATGLGLISGKVIKFNDPTKALRIPHVGWNEVDVQKENPLIPTYIEQETKPRFYFVHSYHAVCQNVEDVLATVHYGTDVTAAVSSGNIYGTQFHPEKSHRFGMDMIKRFVEL
uniref:imidazole glycerol phosphate synthase subunit HisH n=1 Tax=Candidatus Electronema sp. TaxID=2698783 RepID=UPI00405606A5